MGFGVQPNGFTCRPRSAVWLWLHSEVPTNRYLSILSSTYLLDFLTMFNFYVCI